MAAGCGKSVALAAAVEFSRLCGAVVLYVPSCLSLIDGGMYHKNEEEGGWDTPDQARDILNNLVSSHGHRLQRAEAVGRSGSLLEVAEEGLVRGGNVRLAISLGFASPHLLSSHSISPHLSSSLLFSSHFNSFQCGVASAHISFLGVLFHSTSFLFTRFISSDFRSFHFITEMHVCSICSLMSSNS
eukprot:scaffold116709_cov47-Prasinocladus_malaysianus.AAC.3